MAGEPTVDNAITVPLITFVANVPVGPTSVLNPESVLARTGDHGRLRGGPAPHAPSEARYPSNPPPKGPTLALSDARVRTGCGEAIHSMRAYLAAPAVNSSVGGLAHLRVGLEPYEITAELLRGKVSRSASGCRIEHEVPLPRVRRDEPRR
jgi:hypothetical protein